MNNLKKEVVEKVSAIFARYYSISSNELSFEVLLHDYGFGYLDRVEITMGLEEEFNIEINDDEMKKILIFGDLVSYVNLLIQNSQNSE